MDEPRWLTDDELRAWRWLATTMLTLPGRLDEALGKHGVSFFDYSIMAGLSDAVDHTRPMSELALVANGSPSRLSHAAKRLERRGWMVRSTSPEDRRVTLATLTDEGQAFLVEVAPGHVASVREAVFDVLSPEQVAALEDVCSTVVRNINPVRLPWEHDDATPPMQKMVEK